MSQNPKRQPMLVIVCGETGIGKTYRNIQEIKKYLKDNQEIEKKGRKVLAFDVNDDDYTMFKTLSLDSIRQYSKAPSQARRIRPLTKEGRNMTNSQKREVVELMVNNFRNGMVVLDDIDKFMDGVRGQEAVSLLTTNRHSALDLLVGHQSISRISTVEWQNCTFLRLHKQVDEISRYRNRIPNFFIVALATFIVDEQYEMACRAFAEGAISESDYKKRRSYFVYVNMRSLKILGCSKGAFIRAVSKYLDRYAGSQIKMLQQEKNWQSGKPRFANRQEVILHLFNEYLRFWGG